MNSKMRAAIDDLLYVCGGDHDNATAEQVDEVANRHGIDRNDLEAAYSDEIELCCDDVEADWQAEQ